MLFRSRFVVFFLFVFTNFAGHFANAGVEFKFTFANGSALISRPGIGVFYQPKDRAKSEQTLYSGNVRVIPINDEPAATTRIEKWIGPFMRNGANPYYVRLDNLVAPSGESAKTFAYFADHSALYIVQQSGQVSRTDLQDTRFETHEFEHHQALKIHLLKQPGDSDTFIVRIFPYVSGGRTEAQDVLMIDVAGTKASQTKQKAIARSVTKTNDQKISSEDGTTTRKAQEIVAEKFINFSKLVAESNDILDDINPEAIENIRRALIKTKVGNAILTGEAGSGKTETLRTFVKRVQNGDFPEIAANTEFILVDAAALGAGTKYKGVFEARVNALIQYAQKPNVIIIADEVHTLRGSGTHEGSSVDFFDMLKPYLANRKIRLLGTSTHHEYETSFGHDEALLRRLPEIDIPPVPKHEIAERLAKWASSSELAALPVPIYHYITELALDLDAVGSDLVKALRLTEVVYADFAILNSNPNDATRKDIERIATQLYNLPTEMFSKEQRVRKLEEFLPYFDSVLFGHNALKRSFHEDLSMVFTRTEDLGKPRLRYLFAGPRGLAKTYTAEKYAEFLGVPFKRINMAQYAYGKASDELVNEVTSQIRKNAFSIILFDELEKCPLHIQDTLLSITDSDHVFSRGSSSSSAHGPKNTVQIKVSNATFLFATNAAKNYIIENESIDAEKLAEQLRKDGISEFLLDRMREIHPFSPPKTTQEFKQILEYKLKEYLRTQEKRHKIKIDIVNHAEFLEQLTREHFSKDGGFRNVLTKLYKTVGFGLSQEILEGNIEKTGRCTLLLTGNIEPVPPTNLN